MFVIVSIYACVYVCGAAPPVKLNVLLEKVQVLSPTLFWMTTMLILWLFLVSFPGYKVASNMLANVRKILI